MEFEQLMSDENQLARSVFYFENDIYREGAPWKEQYCCFFSGAPKVSRKKELFIWNGSSQ